MITKWLNAPCPRCGGSLYYDDTESDPSYHEWVCLHCARSFDVDFTTGTITPARIKGPSGRPWKGPWQRPPDGGHYKKEGPSSDEELSPSLLDRFSL